MHSREVVDVLTDDDAEVLEAHPVDALVNGRARRMALVVFPLADTADACYCANEFSLREVQQGVLAGAELFL